MKLQAVLNICGYSKRQWHSKIPKEQLTSLSSKGARPWVYCSSSVWNLDKSRKLIQKHSHCTSFEEFSSSSTTRKYNVWWAFSHESQSLCHVFYKCLYLVSAYWRNLASWMAIFIMHVPSLRVSYFLYWLFVSKNLWYWKCYATAFFKQYFLLHTETNKNPETLINSYPINFCQNTCGRFI